jgi:hypothetical protein
MFVKIFSMMWRSVVFFVGDIRRLHAFPWVTWSVHQHEMNYHEVLEVLPLIQYGDVGIHRDAGYLSNIAIPGFMKHGWIHVKDGMQTPSIVEAISDGVIERSAIYPIFSDFTIILSPKNVSDLERKGACKKAKFMLGKKYDVSFKFDIEENIQYYEEETIKVEKEKIINLQKDSQYYKGQNVEEVKKEIKEGLINLEKFDGAFSCTELVSYAWWHKRDDLRLFRKKSRGKSVILADDFLNGEWEIKWMSQSVTVESAKNLGLHEEGILMIKKYIEGKR